MSLDEVKLNEFQPSKFMRARRPELFSDSIYVTAHELGQTQLEYQLETLTNRKQEYDFEYFCRRLAEKELCPNLLPQTGPTGGGDSKVDTETYPVADSIAMRWYEGVGRESSQERWAFAFSTKAKWQTKVEEDVKKIVETQRGYGLIYFITSQFVKDKARAAKEETLQKIHGVPIRILDRSWIVSRVLENNRQQLAIDALKITGYQARKRVIGPRDLAQETELQELESQIATGDRYNGVEYQLAEDCLRAAVLARNLELPRVEVEGRLKRAELMGDKGGIPQQRLRILYTWAWTAFWWFDDFIELNRLYELVEALALNSSQASDVALLTNLWSILNTTVKSGVLTEAVAKLPDRTARLKAELERMAGDRARPSGALQARANSLLIDLALAIGDTARLDGVLAEFKKVLIAGKGLANYPIMPLVAILDELGEALPENQTYEDLFESIIKLTEQRSSSVETGRMLLQRGLQKLIAGKSYDAIRILGRAQSKLALRESRPQLVLALAACGQAYEQAGLLWAARTNMLAAANNALSEFWEHGKVTTLAVRCTQQLAWLELQLGRVPCVLEWTTIARTLGAQLMLEGDKKIDLLNEWDTQDMALGLLLLKADLWDLKWLDFMPEALKSHGLHFSRTAILYALGYEDHLRADGEIPDSETESSVRKLFEVWVDQPASKDLPDMPELLLRPNISLRSSVLGCRIVLTTPNNLGSIQLGETILGILEALLATSLESCVFPYREEFHLSITQSDFGLRLPEYQLEYNSGAPVLKIQHSDRKQPTDINERGAYKQRLLEIVLAAISQIAIIPDAESYFRRIAAREVAFNRAVDIADVCTCVTNILGHSPKLQMAEWRSATSGDSFPLRRSEPWTTRASRNAVKADSESKLPRSGDGDPPVGLDRTKTLKHGDHHILSLIDVPLWDKAQWSATMYLYHPNLLEPPSIGLGFRDSEAAKTIFKGLRSRLGEVDSHELLRVSIITGFDRRNPYSYIVNVGANQTVALKISDNVQYFLVSRLNRMYPLNSTNLDAFLARWRQTGKYWILPVEFTTTSDPPVIYFDHRIEKSELHCREAWQIGRNDPDICALKPDDKPIIPRGVKNPPILDALKWIKTARRRAN